MSVMEMGVRGVRWNSATHGRCATRAHYRLFVMPVNALARQVGFKIGPVVLETLIKRYFDRVKDLQATKLRQDELLYDATFNIIKAIPYLLQ